MEFKGGIVSDAQIYSLLYSNGDLTVLMQSDNNKFEIIFHMVLAVDLTAPEGHDLSHISDECPSAYFFDVCKRSGDNSSDFKEFKFISAWDESILLKIVARNATLGKALS